jgi:hypothetical protein
MYKDKEKLRAYRKEYNSRPEVIAKRQSAEAKEVKAASQKIYLQRPEVKARRSHIAKKYYENNRSKSTYRKKWEAEQDEQDDCPVLVHCKSCFRWVVENCGKERCGIEVKP